MFKVAIIGPESTGKSSLCKSLADYFYTAYVPEFARNYLLTYGKEYTQNDLLKIAEGQTASEKIIEQANASKPFLFIDTEMTVMRVWSEFVFNRCDNRILIKAAEQHYDLFLLCNTDLPWEADELREYPDEASRIKLFHYYLDAMVHQNTPFEIIKGQNESRLKQAINTVEYFSDIKIKD
jgi:NadR type nicotinamide-nucleotide adenylyltransferase